MNLTPHQARYYALELSKRSSSDSLERYGAVLADAKVDLQPHQVDAALFAFKSPLSTGAILADEVGLGKTIEAGLVLGQLWATGKQKLIIICPAHLRKQWAVELEDKFYLPTLIMGSKDFNARHAGGQKNPFDLDKGHERILICSYNFIAKQVKYVQDVRWDLVVLDEAHRLRNVWKPKAKTAKAVKEAVGASRKLLLTATPLQNSLMDLYGLVEVLDPHVFGDLDSFRAQYTRTDSQLDLKDLRDRMRTICQRTLRRQVQEYIRFPERRAVTLQFEPSAEEDALYKEVSAFLERPVIHCLGELQQRHLITIILRKLLASSSYAIGRTLTTLVSSLEKVVRQNLPDGWHMELGTELEGLEDFLDEHGVDIAAMQLDVTADELKEVSDEIRELKRLRDKAVNIEFNAKGEKLITALEDGFKKMRSLGAAEKAIIFTEFTRTQQYLFEKLGQGPFAGRVVLFNGSNNDPQSKEILQRWLARNEGTGKVSSEKEANMRAALVEEFRDRAQIMIATEAGAEGVNLQFCSLVVNYDLPWNPQRVEQRIGRCHRYGQKHDVVVMNFLNERNAADKRVLELLDQKFHLFSGAFGASDEVLGAIESGADIEAAIARIYQDCRTTAAINKAFDELQEKLREPIKQRLRDTRRSILENFDVDVIQRLKMTKADSHIYLQRVEKWLWQLSTMLLKEYARFDQEELRFELQRPPFDHGVRAGTYGLRRDDTEAMHLRLNHPLAKGLIKQARALDTPITEIRFDLSGSPLKVGALRSLAGVSGYLDLTRVEVSSLETTDHLLFTAVTDAGQLLLQDQCRKLMELSAMVLPGPVEAPEDELAARQSDLLKGLDLEVKTKDTQHINTESVKLNRWAQDRQNTADHHLRETKEKIQDLNREASQTSEPTDHLRIQKRLQELERKLRKQRQEIDRIYDKIEEERNALIAKLEGRLRRSISTEPIFTVRFRIV